METTQPTSTSATPGRATRPRDPWLAASAGLLGAIVSIYLAVWIHGHWAYLFDPRVQNDDARCSLAIMHRYGSQGLLADDPIQRDMLFYAPWSTRVTYAVLVPTVGLFVGAKLISLVAYGVLLGAGYIVWRSRRGGLAAAAILVFLCLHTPTIPHWMIGGFARNFAYPLFMLWLAGAIAQRPGVRASAALVAAILHPSPMVVILGMEGMLLALDGVDLRRRQVRRRYRIYALLSVGCFLLLTPYLMLDRNGHVFSYAQAAANPLFTAQGRWDILPFAEPTHEAADYLAAPFLTPGRPLGAITRAYRGMAGTGPMLWLSLMAFMFSAGWAKAPRPAVAALASSAILYALARALAFHLYNPRYFHIYNVLVASIALAVFAFGLSFPKAKPARLKRTLRNFLASGFIVGVCLCAGDGIRPEGAANIAYAEAPTLYAFVKSLPAKVRIAQHPYDGVGIPFWTGRATMDHFETLQPWIVEHWERAEPRTRDTLATLYATRVEDVLAYAKRHGVTHVLLNKGRYQRESFRKEARVFEPLGAWIDPVLAKVEFERLWIHKLTAGDIVFADGPWFVVDVARLAATEAARAGRPAID